MYLSASFVVAAAMRVAQSVRCLCWHEPRIGNDPAYCEPSFTSIGSHYAEACGIRQKAKEKISASTRRNTDPRPFLQEFDVATPNLLPFVTDGAGGVFLKFRHYDKAEYWTGVFVAEPK